MAKSLSLFISVSGLNLSIKYDCPSVIFDVVTTAPVNQEIKKLQKIDNTNNCLVDHLNLSMIKIDLIYNDLFVSHIFN